VVDFSDCQTVLLYPYVTNATNYAFDTALAVSNTTLDPFNVPPPASGFPNLPPTYGKGSAVPQNGDCYFYVYAGGALAGTYDTGTIIAGSTDAFYLSKKVSASVTQGYAIAVCEFQNAHGFAIVENTAPGGVAWANYLADVLPDPAFYHRSPAGDMLGETAIAPWYLNKFFQYLLIYDPPTKKH
jgi:hypothetical protein